MLNINCTNANESLMFFSMPSVIYSIIFIHKQLQREEDFLFDPKRLEDET